MTKQECIPVGCVPSATVAVSRVRGGGGGVCVSAPGGCLLPGGCVCSGGCLLRGGVCSGVCVSALGGLSALGGVCLGGSAPGVGVWYPSMH